MPPLTTLARTIRHTYRVWDADMVRGLDLSHYEAQVLHETLSRDQYRQLDECAECKLTANQITDLKTVLGSD